MVAKTQINIVGIHPLFLHIVLAYLQLSIKNKYHFVSSAIKGLREPKCLSIF